MLRRPRLPLGGQHARRVGAPGKVAAPWVRSPSDAGNPVAPDCHPAAYQLTPTELRVLLGIVNIGGIPEVATALGVAGTTNQRRMSAAFRKNPAAGRQADLVKVVAGFFHPAGGLTHTHVIFGDRAKRGPMINSAASRTRADACFSSFETRERRAPQDEAARDQPPPTASSARLSWRSDYGGNISYGLTPRAWRLMNWLVSQGLTGA